MYYTRTAPVTTINNQQARIEFSLFAKSLEMPNAEGRLDMRGFISDITDHRLSPERRRYILERISTISGAHAKWGDEYEALLIQYVATA